MGAFLELAHNILAVSGSWATARPLSHFCGRKLPDLQIALKLQNLTSTLSNPSIFDFILF
jgi:hypothetical protein